MCKKKKTPTTLNIGQANSIYYPGSWFDLSQTGFERRINGSRILLRGVSAFRLDVDIETKKKERKKKYSDQFSTMSFHESATILYTIYFLFF